jgi:hypothetical protein
MTIGCLERKFILLTHRLNGMVLALASGHWFGHPKGPVAIFDLNVASSALITNPLTFRRRLSSELFPFPGSIPVNGERPLQIESGALIYLLPVR